ncbi:hypothetical protein [Ancylobacter rudongensis]|uniref:DNA ligase OB-like domain-containing protein n=1 Tax=Ancylobacter rudongensis TaxID=177413 RepID=A0A1G4UQB3_9HYPH|nr:hypothetical protein [Ancylobacter rudongensis]SCW95737.1 DNA ligase OB-like domain-containing protein [Ancylobacter rudongensis]
MDAYTVSRRIEEIAATGSRIEKERLLSELAASDLGKFVLNWAYNPFITYGLTAAPTPSDEELNINFRRELIEPLLLKLSRRELTGKAAEREVGEVMRALNPDGARLLYLVLSKDLKCGIAETTINAVMPGLIPIFSVMRAHTFDVKKVKSWPQKLEYKLDGNRNTFIAKDGHGGFFTRTGKRVLSLDFLVQGVLRAAQVALETTTMKELQRTLSQDNGRTLNFMLDGEAMMGLFANTGVFKRTTEDAVGAELHLYDIMSLPDFDAIGSVGYPLEQRRKMLVEFVRQAKAGLPENLKEMIQISPQFFVNNEAEVHEWFEKARAKTLASYLARGDAQKEAELAAATIDKETGKPKVLEGIMVKDPGGLYDKKKSYGWMKMKAEETEDLRIVGFYNGEAGSKYEFTMGGAIVERNGVLIRVGGGWSDKDRADCWELWKQDAALLGIDPLVGFKPGVHFELGRIKAVEATNFLGRLLEVEFHEVTPDGSLRHPRAVRFRDDKDGELETREAA